MNTKSLSGEIELGQAQELAEAEVVNKNWPPR